MKESAAKPSVAGWFAMCASLSGVAIQSLVPDLMRYSFLVFLTAAVLWFINGLGTRNRPLICLQTVLIVLNTIAVYRWFN